jgi:hypothetical protein
MVSSTGAQLGAFGIRLDKINHLPQYRPLIGIEITRCPLLDADEDVGRQQIWWWFVSEVASTLLMTSTEPTGMRCVAVRATD